MFFETDGVPYFRGCDGSLFRYIERFRCEILHRVIIFLTVWLK